MSADIRVPTDSRAVLVGVSAYKDAEFPPIRAARNSLQVMRSLLVDPALCGWPPNLITVIANPTSAADLADRVADLAGDITGVLLLYYVGHGVLSARGELCLTVTSTRPNRPKITGLPWDTLADILRPCPARTRLVILDCCFAGQATEALSGEGDQSLADITYVGGVYTLAATTRNRTAHVPPASQQATACTSFTGELRDLIHSGIPGKSAQLTFSDIYPELRQRLRAKGLPAPSQRGTDTAHQFPFTANTAAHTGPAARTVTAGGNSNGQSATTQKGPEPPHTDPLQLARVLTGALSAAWSIPDEGLKVMNLADIAKMMAAADPDRAARLTVDAERIAQSITDEGGKALALLSLADAVAATDPGRAARLRGDAERLVQSATDSYQKEWALLSLIAAVAATDSNRAERMVQSVDIGSTPSALASIAQVVAATDPDRAARLIGDAENFACSITFKPSKVQALLNIAEAVAPTDPDRAARLRGDAENLARSMMHKDEKVSALLSIARAVAATDPDRAARLIGDALTVAQSNTDSYSRAYALANIAGALAAHDPKGAQRLAQTITDEHSSRSSALANIAETVAATNSNWAEHLAGTITDPANKSRALIRIAEAVAAADSD
jgi:hypothetical protein